MPGPVITAQTLPGWVDPKQRSVFDVPGQGILRTIVGLLGLDDPQQVMALGVPLEAGAANVGGLVEAIATKLPRFAKAIKAFHGSPHDFEKFETAKIGTGEGAQAYGHGLYFAEKEGTARAYRDALSGPRPTGPWSQTDPWEIPGHGVVQSKEDFAHLFSDNIDSPEYRGALEAVRAKTAHGSAFMAGTSAEDIAAMKASKHAQIRIYAEAAELLEQAKRPTGKMYEVNIHADPESFLDWDKPLSQQSPDVRQALERVAKINKSEVPISGGMTGESAYRVAGPYGGPQASARLREAGIPGIKYLDQGSRAAGEGSRNYVVFDETLIDIARKFGLAAALEVYRQKQQQAGAPATVQQ